MMDLLKEFKIPYKGLKNGLHNYHFEIDSTFFANFETSKITKGLYQVDITLDRRDQMMVLDIHFEGEYEGDCDRCLATVNIPCTGRSELIVKIVDEPIESDDDILFLQNKMTHLDLSLILYELIHVGMPIIALRDCNAEDYRYCDHTILDKLDQNDKRGEEEKENPLWEDLKKLKL